MLINGATWSARDGRSFFSQPCVAFRGRCSIYDVNLPHACEAYRCRLLRRCERGAEDWEAAHKLVARTRRLRDLIRDELREVLGEDDPSVALVELVQRLMNDPVPETEAARDVDRINQLRLRSMALVVTLDDLFRLPKTEAGPSNSAP